MCMGGGSSSSPVDPTPVAPPAISEVDTTKGDMSEIRRQRAAAGGAASTILTGSQGAATPTGGGKTLLGA